MNAKAKDWLLVIFTGLAGILAAVAGGMTESILNWVFVGIPLLLLAGAAIYTLAARRRTPRR